MTADASLSDLELDKLIAESPGEELIQRLDDPKIASALSLILDHADLLATIVSSIDGLLRRAEVIGDSLVSGVAEMKGLAGTNGSTALPKVDVAALSDSVSRLSTAAVDATPAIERLLKSPLTDPQIAELLSEAGEALLEGKRAAEEHPGGPRGLFGIMKVTKDPDVSRGLGFMIQIARAFGKRLEATPAAPPQKSKGGGKHAAD